jgi:threonylcarbamoyladenosine tRNA methylthiotransferase MtaB
MSKSVSLHTLGCKLNYSETSTIAKQFEEKGYSIEEYGNPSDIFVLNTCSVTENADKECRQIIRSVIRNNPATYVIVTGCYAQLQPEEIAKIDGVDLVLGANEKFKLFDYMDNFQKENVSCIDESAFKDVKVIRKEVYELDEFVEAYSADNDSRTRAFLKIQDGCDYKCSFCTIPMARGKSRSLDISKVIDNAKKIIDSGYKEIILTGVNTGDYSFEVNLSEEKVLKYKLIDVLYELDKLNINRIRISSIEPNLLTDEILDLYASSDKFCNHFHIPLQSGDSEILKAMRRRYNADFYQNLIYKINDKIKDVGIGVDVIVGFPGESDANFNNTYKFLDSLPISYLHVFSYSERRNTVAIELPGSVDVRKRRFRSQVLRNLSNKKRFEFYTKYTGTEQEVLFETVKDAGIIEGYTRNYIRVKTPYITGIENSIKKVKLLETDSVKPAMGEIIEW